MTKRTDYAPSYTPHNHAYRSQSRRDRVQEACEDVQLRHVRVQPIGGGTYAVTQPNGTVARVCGTAYQSIEALTSYIAEEEARIEHAQRRLSNARAVAAYVTDMAAANATK